MLLDKAKPDLEGDAGLQLKACRAPPAPASRAAHLWDTQGRHSHARGTCFCASELPLSSRWMKGLLPETYPTMPF